MFKVLCLLILLFTLVNLSQALPDGVKILKDATFFEEMLGRSAYALFNNQISTQVGKCGNGCTLYGVRNYKNQPLYATCYCPNEKVPLFTINLLKPGSLSGKNDDRPKVWFAMDTKGEEQTYSNGFDRGHLVPNNDFRDVEDKKQTFMVINRAPQYEQANRVDWAKVEGGLRETVSGLSKNTLVITFLKFEGRKHYAFINPDNKLKSLIPSSYNKVLFVFATPQKIDETINISMENVKQPKQPPVVTGNGKFATKLKENIIKYVPSWMKKNTITIPTSIDKYITEVKTLLKKAEDWTRAHVKLKNLQLFINHFAKNIDLNSKQLKLDKSGVRARLSERLKSIHVGNIKKLTELKEYVIKTFPVKAADLIKQWNLQSVLIDQILVEQSLQDQKSPTKAIVPPTPVKPVVIASGDKVRKQRTKVRQQPYSKRTPNQQLRDLVRQVGQSDAPTLSVVDENINLDELRRERRRIRLEKRLNRNLRRNMEKRNNLKPQTTPNQLEREQLRMAREKKRLAREKERDLSEGVKPKSSHEIDEMIRNIPNKQQKQSQNHVSTYIKKYRNGIMIHTQIEAQ